MNVENNIKVLRQQRKLSQKDLANACDVSRQTINAIENNKYDPTLHLAFELASVLKTPLEELFNYKRSE